MGLEHFRQREPLKNNQESPISQEKALHSTLQFLSDSQRFPNPQINTLITEFSGLIEDNSVTIKPMNGDALTRRMVDRVNFFVEKDYHVDLMLPRDFVDGLNNGKFGSHLGDIVHSASHIKDILERREDHSDEKIKEARVRAHNYRAETLQTLKELVSQPEELQFAMPETQSFEPGITHNVVTFPVGRIK